MLPALEGDTRTTTPVMRLPAGHAAAASSQRRPRRLACASQARASPLRVEGCGRVVGAPSSPIWPPQATCVCAMCVTKADTQERGEACRTQTHDAHTTVPAPHCRPSFHPANSSAATCVAAHGREKPQQPTSRVCISQGHTHTRDVCVMMPAHGGRLLRTYAATQEPLALRRFIALGLLLRLKPVCAPVPKVTR
jgi:hypothetical protein